MSMDLCMAHPHQQRGYPHDCVWLHGLLYECPTYIFNVYISSVYVMYGLHIALTWFHIHMTWIAFDMWIASNIWTSFVYISHHEQPHEHRLIYEQCLIYEQHLVHISPWTASWTASNTYLTMNNHEQFNAYLTMNRPTLSTTFSSRWLLLQSRHSQVYVSP